MSGENMVELVPGIEVLLEAPELVPFGDLVGAATTGPGNISQTTATGGWSAYGQGPSSGAAAILEADGDARVQATIPNAGNRMLGLGKDSYVSGTTFAHVDHAIFTNNIDRLLRVFENGTLMWGGVVGQVESWAVGDTLEIRVEGTAVGYYHNGARFYVSTVALTSASYPLRAQVPIAEIGVRFDDVTVVKHAWVDVSGDVVSDIRAEWGMKGNDPTDRVADVGTLGFTLDNQTGQYAPGNAAALPGWRVGAQARLSLTHALYGTSVKFLGKVESLKQGPSARNPRVSVTCSDWMEEAGRAKLKNVEVLIDTQSDAVFQALVDAVDSQPPNGVVKIAGSDVYPFALDQAKDESTFITTESQKLAQSEVGYVYVQGGAAYFEGRRRRGVSGSALWELDEDLLVAAETSLDREDVRNRIQTLVHPRRRDVAANVVVFSIQDPIEILRGTEVVINGPFRDLSNPDKRIGATDSVTPSAGTDFAFNTRQDESGTDITAQLTVTPTTPVGGNTVELTVRNDGPSDGWLVKLQLRARGLYDYEPLVNESIDPDSVREFGENAFAFDMPYQNKVENGRDTADFFLSQERASATRLEAISFVANWDDTVAQQFLLRAISDRIGVTLPLLGLDKTQFFINGIRLAITRAGLVRVTYTLAPAPVEEFWLLGVAGRSELTETTVLGYGLFVAGWVLGTSQLGTDTFAN